MKVEALPDFEALGRERWNGLVERSRLPSLFLTWQWQTCWTRSFAPDRPLELLSVRDDAGAVAGVLPLYDEDGWRRLIGGVDVSDYLERLDGKDRHELRRKMRRLDRERPGCRVWSQTAREGWDEALTRFLAMHRLSKAGKARFMDERMEGFFREVTRALAEAGWARLWFLEGPEGPLATFLCLEYGGSVGLYNSGFAPAEARLAPGIVLLAHVIRDAIERRVSTFDFLRGEEPYKYAFGATGQDLFAIRVGS
jgi:Acetyltransferase (GNAT) domain